MVSELLANDPLQFFTSLIALASVLPHLTQGLALPEPGTSLDLATRETFIKTFDLLETRADEADEWEMVIYAGSSNGGQCGGTPNNFAGTGNLCEHLLGVQGKLCADLKVGANIGFAKCEFNFKADGTSCGGSSLKDVTLNKGTDNNGVSLSDQVRFVSITCTK